MKRGDRASLYPLKDEFMDINETVRQFVTTNFYVGKSLILTRETSLLDHGVIDSTGVLEIVMFLEQKFGIQVADDEMLPDNLDSIGRIAEFVSRKTTLPAVA